MTFLLFAMLLGASNTHAFVNTDTVSPIFVRPGYVTKVKCTGRLFASAVGNDRLVLLESLPKETGCGVLLKPLAIEGQTNIVLETSIGTITKLVRIQGIKLDKKGVPVGNDSQALPAFSVEVQPDDVVEIESSERGKK